MPSAPRMNFCFQSCIYVAVVPLKIDRLPCRSTSRCRRVLPLHAQGEDMGVSVSLARLLEQAFPCEYRSRRDEVLAERGAAEAGGAHALLTDASAGRVDGGDAVLPIFYLDPMLPKQRLRLNIFEPRYRLMIRRCLEGSRKFGMVGADLHAATRTRFPIPRHGVEVVNLTTDVCMYSFMTTHIHSSMRIYTDTYIYIYIYILCMYIYVYIYI